MMQQLLYLLKTLFLSLASVGWVSEHLDMAQHYLVSLLPSATAAGAGSVVGYRRKRR